MKYAILTLAIHDALQDRIFEEIDQVYNQLAKEGKSALDYERDYVKFPYVLAFVVSHYTFHPPPLSHPVQRSNNSNRPL